MRNASVPIVAVFASLVVPFAAPPGAARGADPESRRPALSEITFERTRCYGPCPAYKVTLRPDGTVTYVGEAHVERPGRREGRIGRRAFERLAALLDNAKFFAMKDEYTSDVTDHPTVITTATRAGGARKTVSNYADTGPAELWGIEMAIDGVLSRASWAKSDRKGKPDEPAK